MSCLLLALNRSILIGFVKEKHQDQQIQKHEKYIFIAIVSILFAAFNSSAKKNLVHLQILSVKTNGIICTYPMHPEVVNDKPDKFPKYEMIPREKRKRQKEQFSQNDVNINLPTCMFHRRVNQENLR